MEVMDFPLSVRIQSPWDTINVCRHCIEMGIPGGYLRFGDGDVNLLEGKGELLQPSNSLLQKEMAETFSLHGEGIVKALPLHSPRFGLWQGMKPGMHESSDQWACNLLNRCFRYFIGNQIFSPVALAYLAVFDKPFTLNFLAFLREHSPIFVGNENIPPPILQKLLNSPVHIKTPAQGSYAAIDRIENETLAEINSRNKSYDVIVLAMGCSGRVLTKRLLSDRCCNVFVFDFGSLMDAICGWSTRAWIDIAEFSPEYFSEMLANSKRSINAKY
jgi:hypothetical protein